MPSLPLVIRNSIYDIVIRNRNLSFPHMFLFFCLNASKFWLLEISLANQRLTCILSF